VIDPIRFNDPDPEIRAEAIRESGLETDPTFAPVFLHALSDPAWEVRLEAITSLTNLGAVMAIPAIRLLLEDDSHQVRNQARFAIRILERERRLTDRFAGDAQVFPRPPAELTWPAWMRRVEIAFATTSSLFAILFTIRFLIGNTIGYDAAGDLLLAFTYIFLMVGLVLFVFVTAGILQAHPHFRDLYILLKHKPWRRIIGFIFLIDLAGFFVGGFPGQIIFLIGLSAGIPLAVAYFASEAWRATHRNQGP